jgi:hypothetical protein
LYRVNIFVLLSFSEWFDISKAQGSSPSHSLLNIFLKALHWESRYGCNAGVGEVFELMDSQDGAFITETVHEGSGKIPELTEETERGADFASVVLSVPWFRNEVDV